METRRQSTSNQQEQCEEKTGMSEYDVLDFAARTLKYDYPATQYRTRHPDTVTPAEIAAMDPYEFSDFATAQSVIDDFRTIPPTHRRTN
jgi:hypothetical protein